MSLKKPISYERGKACNLIIIKGRYIHIRGVSSTKMRNGWKSDSLGGKWMVVKKMPKKDQSGPVWPVQKSGLA